MQRDGGFVAPPTGWDLLPGPWGIAGGAAAGGKVRLRGYGPRGWMQRERAGFVPAQGVLSPTHPHLGWGRRWGWWDEVVPVQKHQVGARASPHVAPGCGGVISPP